jgi:hypothetical protein
MKIRVDARIIAHTDLSERQQQGSQRILGRNAASLRIIPASSDEAVR